MRSHLAMVTCGLNQLIPRCSACLINVSSEVWCNAFLFCYVVRFFFKRKNPTLSIFFAWPSPYAAQVSG